MPDTLLSTPNAYHAHLYWCWRDAEGRATADRLCEVLVMQFGAILGTRREVSGGPHPAAELHVGFPLVRFDDLVPWLMVNRGGLSILVHPMTGDAQADHTTHALWLGPSLPINLDAL